MVTPFEQALTYAESFPRNRQPRFVVVCNFSTFRVHDRDACPPRRARGQVSRVHFGGAWAEPAPTGFRHRPRQQPIRTQEAGLDGGGPPHRRAARPAPGAVYRSGVRREPEGPQHPMRAPGVLPVLRGCGTLPQRRALELSEERRAKEHACRAQKALQGARHSDRKARPLRQVGQALPLRQRGFSRRNPRSPTSPTR